jgi:hypothetical protein
MNHILQVLHFFGFGAGVTASVGNFAILYLMRSAPGDRAALSRVPPVLARIGQVGLALLWGTGLLMVWSIWGGPEAMPPSFWWKMLCVVLLTITVVFLDLTIRKARAGEAASARRLPFIARVAAALLLLTVVFAVAAFN